MRRARQRARIDGRASHTRPLLLRRPHGLPELHASRRRLHQERLQAGRSKDRGGLAGLLPLRGYPDNCRRVPGPSLGTAPG